MEFKQIYNKRDKLWRKQGFGAAQDKGGGEMSAEIGPKVTQLQVKKPGTM
jgi:hypothetical protein